MIQCPRCSHSNANRSLYCGKCGMALKSEPSAVPVNDVSSESAPPIPRRGFLRKRAVGWALVVVFAAGSIFGMAALAKSRAALSAELITTDDALSSEQRKVARLESQLKNEKERAGDLASANTRTRAAAATCRDALQKSVKTWNQMVRSVDAAVEGNIVDFIRFADRSERTRKATNRSLRKCEREMEGAPTGSLA